MEHYLNYVCILVTLGARSAGRQLRCRRGQGGSGRNVYRAVPFDIVFFRTLTAFPPKRFQKLVLKAFQ